MSEAVREYLGSLFGQVERSDVDIVFALEPPLTYTEEADESESELRTDSEGSDESTADAGVDAVDDDAPECSETDEDDPTEPPPSAAAPKERVLVGDPLPGHTLVLCPGSKYFSGQLDFVVAQMEASTLAEASGSGAGPPRRRPQLTVLLQRAEQRPLAEAALLFMYTGELALPKDGLNAPLSVAELLSLRAVAAELAVEGCVRACEQALLASVVLCTMQPDGGPISAASSAAVAGVAELARPVCQALLPLADSGPTGADPTAEALLDALFAACRATLVQHCRAIARAREAAAFAAEAAAAEAQRAVDRGGGELRPDAEAHAARAAAAAEGAASDVYQLEDGSLGELLAFAFHDAPFVLCDPKAKQQLLALPAFALATLLASDDFGTDDEDTVVVLLAEWRAANMECPEEAQDLLRGMVRVCHVNDDFLLHVLPLVPWFGLSWELACWIRLWRHTTDRAQLKESGLIKNHGDPVDVESTWFALERRPQTTYLPEKLAWHVAADELGPSWDTKATLFNGASKVVVGGYRWGVRVRLSHGRACAVGLCLTCKIPTSLRVPASLRANVCSAAVPILAVLEPGTNRSVAVGHHSGFYKTKMTMIGGLLGFHGSLILMEAPGAEPSTPTPPQQQPAAQPVRQQAQQAAAQQLAARFARYLNGRQLRGTLSVVWEKLWEDDWSDTTMDEESGVREDTESSEGGSDAMDES